MLNQGQKKALFMALHGYADAEQRWTEWRQRGLSDAELRRRIGFEFGAMVAMSGPDGCDFLAFSANGGAAPAIWIGSGSSCVTVPDGKPTLSGQALLGAVRELLEIPLPGERFKNSWLYFSR